MTRTCPRCELRFRTEAELKEHLAVDHAVAGEVLDRYGYRAAHEMQPLYADDLDSNVRRILVVANQTLGGRVLLEHVRERISHGPAELIVVVPSTHSAAALAAGRTAIAVPTDETDETGAAQAAWRLRMALQRLGELGVPITGEIGPPDPVEAVRQVVGRQRVDEVVLSTLPPGLSRWLDADVPERIRRTLKLPVTVVTVPTQERSTIA